jgi:hypothetical protein
MPGADEPPDGAGMGAFVTDRGVGERRTMLIGYGIRVTGCFVSERLTI